MSAIKKKDTKRSRQKITTDNPAAIDENIASLKGQPFRIVGIGASAGGLDAFEQFFRNMPSDCGMAFVIVQHLDPARQSSLPDILTRYTKMHIFEATDGITVRPNTIYIIPPNKSMGILKGSLYLQDPIPPRGLRLPVDFFFRSLAKEKGTEAICIIFSGTGTDGTLGLRAIKAESGTVFVQDPQSAKYDGMPRSAINTGLADFVLPPEQIPTKLMQFIQHSAINGDRVGAAVEDEREPLQQIFAIMRIRTGHNFAQYKQTTICRRLERRMSVNQIHDIAEYAHLLKGNEVEIKALLKDILIGVTNFFRDPEAFKSLKKTLKELISKKAQDDTLRIWVAGCATGEEAYSVAIIVSECLNELEKHLVVQIYATDIDDEALTTARSGIYSTNIAADVTPKRLRLSFIKEGNHYRIRKEIRDMVVMASQDFIKDPPFSKLDLLCCRNLLIYLERDMQRRILPLLHYALKPDGILFLGPSESTGDANDLFNLIDRKWKIYQRREVEVSAERLRFPAAFAPAKQSRETTGDLVQEVIETRIPQLTEKIFLDNYAPTFAVIDEKYRLVYVRGRTGKYLEIASGQPSLSILEMAREGLRVDLTSVIYQAISDKKKVVRDGIRIKYESGFQTINLTVAPLSEHGMLTGLLMVIFQEVGLVTAESKVEPSTKSRKRVAELEEQLKFTRENLQMTIEELEATNEELKSANEELQSNNEEMQSTNEELDTSREEMQSLNEELTTLNAEIQDRNDQLTKANDDLRNFLDRTDIPIIFLDYELIIRRFTPAMVDVFNLRSIDIGRPISDIASRMNYETLVNDAREVLHTLNSKEMEVQRKDGHWFNMRILPYLTAHNKVNGLVISFQDIDKLKQVERMTQESEEQYRALYDEAPIAYFSVGKDDLIKRANRRAMEMFGYSLDKLVGMPVLDLYADTFDGKAKAQTVFERFLALEEVYDVELEMCRSDGSRIWTSSTVRSILTEEGQVVASRLAVIDITERKRVEEALHERQKYLNLAQMVAQTGSWRLDARHNQLLWSNEAYHILDIPQKTPIAFEIFLSYVHADDREYVDRKWNAALQGSEFDIVHRLIIGDEVKWVRQKAEFEFDKRGILKDSFGIIQDITAIREAERK